MLKEAPAKAAISDRLPVIEQPPSVGPALTGGLTALGLAAAFYAAIAGPTASAPLQAKIFMVLWLVVSVSITLTITPRHFTAGFLAGLGAMLIGWRIAALNDIGLVSYMLLLAFIAFVVQFFDCIRRDLQSSGPVQTLSGWMLTFIRAYVGFDLVPHFTEKLFGGPAPFNDDVAVFAQLGLPFPELFVVLGGLCEFGIMVGFGLGLFTRLAAPCAALYYLIATIAGGHFSSGFIWANGGWEYSALMIVLFLTFAYAGAGAFSLDRALIAAGRMRPSLMVFSVRREAPGFD